MECLQTEEYMFKELELKIINNLLRDKDSAAEICK